MKGLDVFIVRFLPFILYIIFTINVLCCMNGIDIMDSYNLHGNSLPYALGLFIVSLSNKKYHCVYNRAMYVFLMVVPVINYLDVKLVFFEDNDSYLLAIMILLISTAIITAYLAIRHFVQASKRRLEHGN